MSSGLQMSCLKAEPRKVSPQSQPGPQAPPSDDNLIISITTGVSSVTYLGPCIEPGPCDLAPGSLDTAGLWAKHGTCLQNGAKVQSLVQLKISIDTYYASITILNA